MAEVQNVKKRTRDDDDDSEEEGAESGIESPEVKRLKENLLESLDEEPDFCSSNQDLDSFMNSFEEEITASPSATGEFGVIDLTSDSGESQPELGYLFEASDDELGIPPPTSSPDGVKDELRTELVRVESDPSEFGGEFWEDTNCDSFGFGFVESDSYNGEYVAIDGFDYSDLGVGSGDYPYRPETLPAQ